MYGLVLNASLQADGWRSFNCAFVTDEDPAVTDIINRSTFLTLLVSCPRLKSKHYTISLHLPILRTKNVYTAKTLSNAYT